MTNAQVILEAYRQQLIHRILLLPLTDDYLLWLARPCQLPLPFPSLRVAPLYRHLDLLLADWHHHQRTTEALQLRYAAWRT